MILQLFVHKTSHQVIKISPNICKLMAQMLNSYYHLVMRTQWGLLFPTENGQPMHLFYSLKRCISPSLISTTVVILFDLVSTVLGWPTLWRSMFLLGGIHRKPGMTITRGACASWGIHLEPIGRSKGFHTVCLHFRITIVDTWIQVIHMLPVTTSQG